MPSINEFIRENKYYIGLATVGFFAYKTYQYLAGGKSNKSQSRQNRKNIFNDSIHNAATLSLEKDALKSHEEDGPVSITDSDGYRDYSRDQRDKEELRQRISNQEERLEDERNDLDQLYGDFSDAVEARDMIDKALRK